MTLIELTLRYTRYLLYREQHRMGQFSGSADCCNLWEMIHACFGDFDRHPQVALVDIIDRAKRQLSIAPNELAPNPLDLAYWSLEANPQFDEEAFLDDTMAYVRRQNPFDKRPE